MVYVEVTRAGEVITRRPVDADQAEVGIRIRLEGGEVTLRAGESATIGDCHVRLVAERADQTLDALAAADDAPGAQAPPPLPRVEGYRVVEHIGSGGVAGVYRAVQESTGREVALKILPAGSFASAKSRARFQREVQLAARLEHPHIARVYDSGLMRGAYFYAMELIDGCSLDAYVVAHELDHRAVVALMATVCSAVQVAHQQGVVHRDLKPSNVLVTADGQPHVLDFGLAKGREDDETHVALTIDGEVSGTPAYMSPEQASGHLEQTDARSDVYSLGVILYRLLTGESPVDLSGTHFEIRNRIVAGETQGAREIDPSIDVDVDAILRKALATDREERYVDAGSLAYDLTAYLEGRPVSARRATASYLLGKKLRRHRSRIVLAGCVALALLGVGMTLWAWLRESPAPAPAPQPPTIAQPPTPPATPPKSLPPRPGRKSGGGEGSAPKPGHRKPLRPGGGRRGGRENPAGPNSPKPTRPTPKPTRPGPGGSMGGPPGGEAIQRLLDDIDRARAAGQWDQAARAAEAALQQARVDRSAFESSLTTEAKVLAARATLAARIATAEEALRRNPANRMVRRQLVLLYLVGADDPVRARSQCLQSGDPDRLARLQLACGDPTKLTASECIALGQWYRTLGDKAQPLGRYAMLCRAESYFEIALRQSSLTAEDRREAASALRATHETLESIRQGGAAWMDVLSLIHPARDASSGTWRREKQGISSAAGRATLHAPVQLQGSTEYEVRLGFVSPSGGGWPVVVLPVGTGAGRIALRLGDGAQKFVGIGRMPPGKRWAVSAAKPLAARAEHTVRIDVAVVGEAARVDVTLGQEVLLRWHGRVDKLSRTPGMPAPPGITLVTEGGPLTVTALAVRSLTGRWRPWKPLSPQGLEASGARNPEPPTTTPPTSATPPSATPATPAPAEPTRPASPPAGPDAPAPGPTAPPVRRPYPPGLDDREDPPPRRLPGRRDLPPRPRPR